MTAKNGRKLIFGISRQLTLLIPRRSKISTELLYLALMLDLIQKYMNNIFKQSTLNVIVFKLQAVIVATAQLCNELQVYNFTLLVGEKHILTKYCKFNSFQVTSNLLNKDNLKVAFAQLYNELQVCNLLCYS